MNTGVHISGNVDKSITSYKDAVKEIFETAYQYRQDSECVKLAIENLSKSMPQTVHNRIDNCAFSG